MKLVLSTLQVSSCIPVSAEEVISYILHKNPHRQLDLESDEESIADDMSAGSSAKDKSQFLRPPTNAGVDSDRGPASPQRVAERAAMRSLRGHRQYIIMDCRPRTEFESCRLAPALHLDPDLLVSPDDLDAKLKEFMPLQVKCPRGGCTRMRRVVGWCDKWFCSSVAAVFASSGVVIQYCNVQH